MHSDDDILTRSIATAFDRLPEPDAARLEALERRVMRHAVPRQRRRTRAGFWWLFAALIATGAAAWWGGRYVGHEPGSGIRHPVSIERTLPSGPAASPSHSTPRRPSTDDESPPSHEIYRREKY